LIEKIRHVSNPLTVIAIFAGVTDVSGTVVLPFVATQNQVLFLWFLMLFPTLLVGLFFWTLIFRHRVLYAPSDYREDSAFLAMANFSYNKIETPGAAGILIDEPAKSTEAPR
jgi:hypothetical protein